MESRAEVLRWYIEINSGGVIHTEEEIERVKCLLTKEDQSGAAQGDTPGEKGRMPTA